MARDDDVGRGVRQWALSGGLYRGVASEARLVLVKCGSIRRITHEDIQRGLEWVVRNRRRYGIRIANVSGGGDYEATYLKDGLSQAAERATREGILVCAAVGNLGHLPEHPVLPPASAPSALTVGGLDDQNRLAFAAYGMYHSSFGPTVDGLQKPEVIAPGIWVAAPILPGTPTASQAELLSRLDAAPDAQMSTVLASHAGVDAELDAAAGLAPGLLRQLVRLKLKDQKVISGAYKHVDGTSFAAPIVASIAAQMLEANPRLAPHELKRLLVRTARRIANVDVDRQGWGSVDARRSASGRPRGAVRAAGRVRPRTRIPALTPRFQDLRRQRRQSALKLPERPQGGLPCRPSGIHFREGGTSIGRVRPRTRIPALTPRFQDLRRQSALKLKGRLAAPLTRPAEGPLFGGEGFVSGIWYRLD